MIVHGFVMAYCHLQKIEGPVKKYVDLEALFDQRYHMSLMAAKHGTK
jgi:hypothetical protein